MQTQDKETTHIATSIRRSRRIPWITGLSMLIIITLLLGIGATVLAYTHTADNSQTVTNTWQRVLKGYTLMSLTAAPSNPAVLYACGVPSQSATIVPYRPSQPMVSYTLLRSADSGTTWQEVTHLMADCQLAINPVQSNDLYVVGLAGHLASNGGVPNVLKHSTDGGRSWTDIAPVVSTGNIQLSVVWHVQQLTMVGNQLFGIQLLPTAMLQPIVKPSPASVLTRLDLARLVQSSDGGHTWTIVDGNLSETAQGTNSYTVSPSNPQTIYELAGPQLFPYTITPKNITTYSRNLTLYKTANGGSTWTKLREDIQYGSKIQIASKQPSLVFLGGSTGVLTPNGADVTPLLGRFSLAVSKDGGTTWQTIKQPTQGLLVQNWFVDATGQLYIATGAVVAGQPTGTIGTAVPVGTKHIKPVGVIISGSSGVQVGSVTAIQRYDVASNTWTTVTKTPSSGTLLAVTDSLTQHTTTLWFLSDANGEQVLYRKTL